MRALHKVFFIQCRLQRNLSLSKINVLNKLLFTMYISQPVFKDCSKDCLHSRFGRFLKDYSKNCLHSRFGRFLVSSKFYKIFVQMLRLGSIIDLTQRTNINLLYFKIMIFLCHVYEMLVLQL